MFSEDNEWVSMQCRLALASASFSLLNIQYLQSIVSQLWHTEVESELCVIPSKIIYMYTYTHIHSRNTATALAGTIFFCTSLSSNYPHPPLLGTKKNREKEIDRWSSQAGLAAWHAVYPL